jgi:hypothetical protein
MYRIAGKRGEARKTITRNAHGAVLELHTDGVPKTNADWHYDLRRNRLCIYGGLLRFIDACIAGGHPELAHRVVSFLNWYVVEQTSPTITGEMAALKDEAA